MSTESLETYLARTYFLDTDHPAIQAWVEQTTSTAQTDVEKAIALFNATRDDIFYNPYHVDFTPPFFKASNTLERGRSFCVAKAILYATGLRVVGIPSRLGFADVRNHLSSQRLLDLMKSDVFTYHGYTELYLNGKWRKATPTFNTSLCHKINIPVLDFDGENDALFHAYTNDGQRHMEYIHYHEPSDDFHITSLLNAWKKHYPHFFGNNTYSQIHGNFEKELLEDRRLNS